MQEKLFEIKYLEVHHLKKGIKKPYYFVLLLQGKAEFLVDFTKYNCDGYSFVFLSPYQIFQLKQYDATVIETLLFHGDFYCIEYHKKEVACNGILFNNIYHQPFVSVSAAVFDEIRDILNRMRRIEAVRNDYDMSVLKSYLQLILALSSKEKQQQIYFAAIDSSILESIINFQTVLEAHFLTTKEVSFYAAHFGLAVNSFSKKIKKHFGKSPSKLIQERIVLEAKKLLHLTYKPIKEIAALLNFQDEYYFSRYFKKEVGIAPAQYRKKIGVSIVAKSSI